jgi:hypothetical protein
MANLQATDVNGTLTSLRTENTKTADHTLALADRDRVVAFTGSSAQTCTVPPDSSVNFPIGSVVYIARFGSGGVTLAAGSGVNLSKTGTFSENEEMYIRKRAANTWVVIDSPKNLSGDGGVLSVAAGYNIHTFTSGSSSFDVA